MASDLGLYCLHVSHKKDARLIWVNRFCFYIKENNEELNEMFPLSPVPIILLGFLCRKTSSLEIEPTLCTALFCLI